MQNYELEVGIRCPLELAFAVYIDIDRWRNRSLFGDIRWVKGKPFEEGSRLMIETRVPLASKIDHVVQHFAVNDSVTYLSHVLGITIETRIRFFRVSAGETLIRVRMQMVGKLSRALGFAIEPVIMRSTKQFFDDVRRDCEEAAKKAEGGYSASGGA